VTEFITPGFNQGEKSACFSVEICVKKVYRRFYGKIPQIKWNKKEFLQSN
jgi:hypothetical protein